MEIARHWRLRKQRYRLEGEECESCEEKIFPPRDICPGCGDKTSNSFTFSGKGTIYSHTKVIDAPAGFEENAPYTIAMVKLEEGPMVIAQLTDLDENREVEIGTPVEMVTRKLREDGDERGLIIYGYKFRPVNSNLSGEIYSFSAKK